MNESKHIVWQSAPPSEFRPCKYRILRTPVGSSISGIILSENVLGTATHYLGGRTQPCIGSLCPCATKPIRQDWHGYVYLLGKKTREIVIFEITAGPALKLNENWNRYKTIRGLEVLFSRTGTNTNGKVICNCGDLVRNADELPSVPDITEMMSAIWGLGQNNDHSVMSVGIDSISEADLVRDGIRKHVSLNGQKFISNGLDH